MFQCTAGEMRVRVPPMPRFRCYFFLGGGGGGGGGGWAGGLG